jgi:acetyl/propionyl-CoA carboxylase alpha subunit
VGYRGAGTVEMLLDRSGEFFFLEMNTRLQVEHPVTELIFGIDLVVQQLLVADGQPLAFGQDDLVQRGHAIEVRLYAEDPAAGFLPQTGTVGLFEAGSGPGVRVDAGVSTGMQVGTWYDPMLAKICAVGGDRHEARRRLVEALRDTVLLGVNTNQEWLITVLEHEDFAAGRVHTGFLPEHGLVGGTGTAVVDDPLLVAAAAILSNTAAPGRRTESENAGPAPVWQQLGPWRSGRRGAD